MTELTWAEVAALETEGTPTDTLAELVLSEVYETRVDHEFVVRDCIARIHALKAKRERTAALLATLTRRYREQIEAYERDEARLRDSVQTYLERFNDGKAISFPDVGGAHLRTVNKGGKARVADLAALQEYITETLPAVREAVVEKVEVWDTAKALELALDALDLAVTPDGKLVQRGTGEVADAEALGLEVAAEAKAVTVKGAA